MSRMMYNLPPSMFTDASPSLDPLLALQIQNAPPVPQAPFLSAGQSAGVGAVAGAGLALWNAFETNSAIQRSMNSAARSFTATAGQIGNAADQQLENNRRQREISIGRIRTALAASGGLGGQTDTNLELQARGDYGRAKAILEDNRSAQIAAARSQYEAQVASLRARSQVPILSALSGGLQGATTGLQLFSIL